MSVFEALGKLRVLPVVKIEEASFAGELASALCEGGLPAIEITFRTKAATAALQHVATSHPDVLLAAGTVVTVEQAKAAIDSGARIIVSPGLSTAVVEHCLKAGVEVLPGVCTPTEIETARSFGLDHLKFFPAEAYGGVKTLKALSAVYGQFKFVPTGGVNPGNLRDYLQLPTVLACGGSWLTPSDAMNPQGTARITQLAKEAVATARGAT